MDIRQLAYFAKLAESSSLTEAAEALNVSQPALGMQIRKLEDYLDVALIERHSRGVRLTEAGAALHRHATAILGGINQAKQDLRRFNAHPSGTVRIGVTPSLGRVLVPNLLEACADRHPDLRLQFVQGFTEQLETQIEGQTLDFAVTARPFDTERLESLPLYVETFLLIGRRELLPTGAEPLPVEALRDLPLALDERSQNIRKVVDGAAAAANVELTNVLELSAINLRRELAIQGKRATIGTRALFWTDIVSGTLVTRDLAIDGLCIPLNLTGHRVETMRPAEKLVRALIPQLVDAAVARGDFGWQPSTH